MMRQSLKKREKSKENIHKLNLIFFNVINLLIFPLVGHALYIPSHFIGIK